MYALQIIVVCLPCRFLMPRDIQSMTFLQPEERAALQVGMCGRHALGSLADKQLLLPNDCTPSLHRSGIVVMSAPIPCLPRHQCPGTAAWSFDLLRWQ